MKTLGYLLLAVGFLGASGIAVQTEQNEVNWMLFLPTAAVAAIGVGLAQYGIKRQAQEAIDAGGGLRPLVDAIDAIVSSIKILDGEKNTLNPYDVHGRIDELFILDLATFVEHRKRIGNIHGLQKYAEIMNEFAAGERYLNRVWSASVDGYVDEVRTYIGKARSQFERAQNLVHALERT